MQPHDSTVNMHVTNNTCMQTTGSDTHVLFNLGHAMQLAQSQLPGLGLVLQVNLLLKQHAKGLASKQVYIST